MLKIQWPSDKLLRRINNLLLGVIVFTNGYVLVMPVLPRVDYEVKQRISRPVKLPAEDAASKIDRTHNHLVLPTLQLDESVFEGTSPYTVHKGIWRRPNTSTPDKGGNTVLVGHRFTYQGAAVFYNLDKLKIGDDAYVAYNQKIYHYRVSQMAVVDPNNSAVEAPSSDNKLTIYTCTPLWTSKQRLVYIADLVEVK